MNAAQPRCCRIIAGRSGVADAIKGLAGKYAPAARQSWPGGGGETLEAAVFAIEELEETAKLYLLLRG